MSGEEVQERLKFHAWVQWVAFSQWCALREYADTEARIIAYLAENYPPDAAQRRAALSPDLMPPNPYAAAPN